MKFKVWIDQINETAIEVDASDREDKEVNLNGTEWALVADGVLAPSMGSTPRLKPGIYKPVYTGRQWGIGHLAVNHDGLYDLGDPNQAAIMRNLDQFLERRDRYEKYGLVYKRGVLMHGIPGAGKTVMIGQIMERIVGMGGIALFADSGIGATKIAVDMIKAVQPNDLLVVLIEDIDNYCDDEDDERTLLEMLDGNTQSNNIVYIATTNNLGSIPDRIKSRPSRFDVLAEIKAPGPEARLAYLRRLDDQMTAAEAEEIVSLTDGLVMAQLKEIFLLVRVYDHTIADAVARFKS